MKRVVHRSIKTSLITNLAFSTVLLLTVVLAAIFVLIYFEQQAQRITSQYEPQIHRVSQIKNHMIFISLEARHAMLAAGDEKESKLTMDRIGENRRLLLELMDQIEADARTDKGKEIVARMRERDKEFWGIAGRIVGTIQAGDVPGAFDILKKEIVDVRNAQIRNIDDLKDHKRQQMSLALSEAAEMARTAKIALGALVLLTFLISGYLTVRFISSVVGRLEHLQDTIMKVEQGGDCTLRTRLEGFDELGKTAQAFDSMMTRIATLVADARNSANSIAKAVHTMTEAGARVENSSSVQTEAATSVSVLIEKTASGVSETAENARAADGMAAQTRADIEKTLAAVRETAGSVGELAGMIDEASKDVTRLSDSSRKIDGIVRTIREIADQTNLLALNAAIEAARAGDQGRGFAVVADEVRKLAENTAKATGEISGLISDVQVQVDAAVVRMQSANEKAGVTRSHVVESTGALDTAGASIRQVTESVRTIAEAMREQSAAVQEVAQRIEQISRMSGENTQAARSSTEVARNLDREAVRLREAIGRFSA